MKKIIIFLVSCVLLLVSVSASAQITLPNPAGVKTFEALISAIANFIASLVGGLAVIMFIWSGILYLTSRGDPGQLQKAHKALLYAVIGAAIALSAAALIALIKYILGTK